MPFFIAFLPFHPCVAFSDGEDLLLVAGLRVVCRESRRESPGRPGEGKELFSLKASRYPVEESPEFDVGSLRF